MDTSVRGGRIAFGKEIQGSGVDIDSSRLGKVGHAVIAAVALGVLHERSGFGIGVGLAVQQNCRNHYVPLVAFFHHLVQLAGIALVHVIGHTSELVLNSVIAALHGINYRIQNNVYGYARDTQIIEIRKVTVGDKTAKALLGGGFDRRRTGKRIDGIRITRVGCERLFVALYTDDGETG